MIWKKKRTKSTLNHLISFYLFFSVLEIIINNLLGCEMCISYLQFDPITDLTVFRIFCDSSVNVSSITICNVKIHYEADPMRREKNIFYNAAANTELALKHSYSTVNIHSCYCLHLKLFPSNKKWPNFWRNRMNDEKCMPSILDLNKGHLIITIQTRNFFPSIISGQCLNTKLSGVLLG